MKKTLSLILVLALAMCLCVTAFAADSYSVTLVNGMDGSTIDTVDVADGEDLVFVISCDAPADMGPVADGEEGSGVETTSGDIAYSDITLGGPNDYPTVETVTISGIDEDCTVTITPNPDEVEAEFPSVTIGGEASGSASDEASGEASGEMDVESYMPDQGDYAKDFEGYREYCIDGYLADSFHPEELEEATVAELSDPDITEENYLDTSYWSNLVSDSLGVMLTYEEFLAY